MGGAVELLQHGCQRAAGTVTLSVLKCRQRLGCAAGSAYSGVRQQHGVLGVLPCALQVQGKGNRGHVECRIDSWAMECCFELSLL